MSVREWAEQMLQSRGWGMWLGFKFYSHHCVLFCLTLSNVNTRSHSQLNPIKTFHSHTHTPNIPFLTSIHVPTLIKYCVSNCPYLNLPLQMFTLLHTHINFIHPHVSFQSLPEYKYNHALDIPFATSVHILTASFAFSDSVFSKMSTLISTCPHTHSRSLPPPPGHWAPPDTQIQRWSDIHWWVEERPPGEEDGPPGVLRRRHVCAGRRRLARRQGWALPAAGGRDRAHLPRVLWQDRWETQTRVHTCLAARTMNILSVQETLRNTCSGHFLVSIDSRQQGNTSVCALASWRYAQVCVVRNREVALRKRRGCRGNKWRWRKGAKGRVGERKERTFWWGGMEFESVCMCVFMYASQCVLILSERRSCQCLVSSSLIFHT